MEWGTLIIKCKKSKFFSKELYFMNIKKMMLFVGLVGSVGINLLGKDAFSMGHAFNKFLGKDAFSTGRAFGKGVYLESVLGRLLAEEAVASVAEKSFFKGSFINRLYK